MPELRCPTRVKGFLKSYYHLFLQCQIPMCSVALGKFNYAILLKHLSFAIKSGIEQRDAAVKMGGMGATTLLFSKGKFMMPTLNYDCSKERTPCTQIID